MNNKGFTLIEVLVSVFIIGIIGVVVINYAGSTLSISKSEAYKIMKDNIVSAGYDYLSECNASTISCNLEWVDNKSIFSLVELKNTGYFSDLKSPVDGEDLGNCINLVVTRESGNINIELVDDCY